ncbi:NAD-dependent succinate-semialdehyde dehydrogenase [Staphylococcus arlettae]|uniref:NAD-dependent succinate-semialdehyde dehydrogenase n=1 Tax=Staphylococcus arlettae TaxID=29378 RepID=UPI001072D97D|nr:NAD-dependent succinate-semialdehyde dehydrogenase [Staphylococcus arlettae]MBF0737057.1 NAD-dependent succinate-semialdehyde dehydrogenase [Staphylococcus arlettae]MCD8834476.1 NAD-dependent succinate-semialdehyde dehydrogenase [Staphylococcus arlettae]MCD8888911.1 NAD-dependent succinate-semialdehyde dehydrogenase [Staphylococcus arlettae]QZZ03768.1 NAD-dependent succinate-semialdehyde dehydrogenase [Staphylococcus arlettae]TFU48209.1 NAD-dependent succinate-semialdehyde dehydrogenase [St
MSDKLNHNWINGQQFTTTNSLQVVNPANGETIGEVPKVDAEAVKQSINAAHQAFNTWSNYTAEYRGAVLEQWAHNLLAKQEELATIMSEEQGKPYAEAYGEIGVCAKFIKWYAEEGKRIYGEIIPPSSPQQRISVIKQPVGVCGLITPWNFPGAMIARKVAPALAAGCTVIVKPSSETPRIAIAIFDELLATDIDAGVANIITGSASLISDTLFDDARVRKISFTGSTAIGKSLMKKAADNITRISLELGGNAPTIVLPDADLDQAADAVVENKFENTGQMCNGINTVLVHKDITTAFTNKVIERVKKLKVGPATDKNAQVGPLINHGAIDKVSTLVADAQSNGATVATGGQKLALSDFGLFYEPTVVTNVTADMNIAQEEIFGPVAPIIEFESVEEAIKIANASPYGLAAYFFTNNINTVYKISEQLEFGMIGVNGTQLSVPQAPFGGIKESGMGREGGHHGLDGFLELKYISLSLHE